MSWICSCSYVENMYVEIYIYRFNLKWKTTDTDSGYIFHTIYVTHPQLWLHSWLNYAKQDKNCCAIVIDFRELWIIYDLTPNTLGKTYKKQSRGVRFISGLRRFLHLNCSGIRLLSLHSLGLWKSHREISRNLETTRYHFEIISSLLNFMRGHYSSVAETPVPFQINAIILTPSIAYTVIPWNLTEYNSTWVMKWLRDIMWFGDKTSSRLVKGAQVP